VLACAGLRLVCQKELNHRRSRHMGSHLWQVYVAWYAAHDLYVHALNGGKYTVGPCAACWCAGGQGQVLGPSSFLQLCYALRGAHALV
jgi:hypothetical protein